MKTISIHPYQVGTIGETVRHHAIYYYKHWKFDARFEVQVARELSMFIREFDSVRDGFWWAEKNGEFAGVIAVSGSTEKDKQARLRWFMVPEKFQGDGVGALLFEQAMGFCREQGFSSVSLWTFNGLAGARKLYDRAGFRLVEELQGDSWGAVVTEQKLELLL